MKQPTSNTIQFPENPTPEQLAELEADIEAINANETAIRLQMMEKWPDIPNPLMTSEQLTECFRLRSSKSIPVAQFVKPKPTVYQRIVIKLKTIFQ